MHRFNIFKCRVTFRVDAAGYHVSGQGNWGNCSATCPSNVKPGKTKREIKYFFYFIFTILIFYSSICKNRNKGEKFFPSKIVNECIQEINFKRQDLNRLFSKFQNAGDPQYLFVMCRSTARMPDATEQPAGQSVESVSGQLRSQAKQVSIRPAAEPD